MPDPDFDPDDMAGMKWFKIRIPFEWILKVWRKLFKPCASTEEGGKGDSNEKV